MFYESLTERMLLIIYFEILKLTKLKGGNEAIDFG